MGFGDVAPEQAESKQGGEDGHQHLGAIRVGSAPHPSPLGGQKAAPVGQWDLSCPVLGDTLVRLLLILPIPPTAP